MKNVSLLAKMKTTLMYQKKDSVSSSRVKRFICVVQGHTFKVPLNIRHLDCRTKCMDCKVVYDTPCAMWLEIERNLRDEMFEDAEHFDEDKEF